MDECIPLIQRIVDTVKELRSEALVLCHGGPIAFPADAARVFERVRGIDGFYGASSTERFPTEVAIKKQIEEFTALRLPRGKK
jgi:predicted TIM-barrel enzyme